MSERSRKGYDLEELLANPRFEQWNASSYKLLCLVALGRDGMGMDLGYDPTGLKEPPTPYERDLAFKIILEVLRHAPFPSHGRTLCFTTLGWLQLNHKRAIDDHELKYFFLNCE